MHIFVDFDGVLHPLHTEAIDDYGQLLPNPALFCWLPILEKALAGYPDVKIIVSSDWRRLCADEKLIELLGNLGSRFAGVVEARGCDRAAEIQADAARRGVRDWVGLDDHASVHAASATEPRFIPCDPRLGVSDESVMMRLRAALEAAQEARTALWSEVGENIMRGQAE